MTQELLSAIGGIAQGNISALNYLAQLARGEFGALDLSPNERWKIMAWAVTSLEKMGAHAEAHLEHISRAQEW